jgi:hypothetical protein
MKLIPRFFLPYCCLAAAACTSAVVIPESLSPGSGESLAVTMPARGVQIYQCRARKGDDGAYEWAFVAPEAELLDSRGHVVGHHGAGPSWEAKDGSRVTATVKARADAPDTRAIPWLLLAAKSSGPTGTLGNVTSVQRVDTHGGVAPADGCTRETLGKEARVHYLAEYRFFTPRTER